MKKHIFVLVVSIFGASPAYSSEVLTGDIRLACEALLCLSSGTRPDACAASLSRYFSIQRRRFSNTLRARLNFLNLCPVANQTPEMQALVVAIRDGAGRCDAQFLNQTLIQQRTREVCPTWRHSDHTCRTETIRVIDDTQPVYCAIYDNHEYTSDVGARYVGTPENGGYWVDSLDFERALTEYNANLAAEAEQEGNFSLQFRR